MPSTSQGPKKSRMSSSKGPRTKLGSDRNQEKLLAYKGVGMSPPPLGISQIFLKDQNLVSLLCSLPLFSLFKLLRLFNSLSLSFSLSFCYFRLKKGSLTSTSRLAPFLRLSWVSEFSLNAKLVLSLEGDKRLAERANDALSACLRDIFPSRFLLFAKRADASLSG